MIRVAANLKKSAEIYLLCPRLAGKLLCQLPLVRAIGGWIDTGEIAAMKAVSLGGTEPPTLRDHGGLRPGGLILSRGQTVANIRHELAGTA